MAFELGLDKWVGFGFVETHLLEEETGREKAFQ